MSAQTNSSTCPTEAMFASAPLALIGKNIRKDACAKRNSTATVDGLHRSRLHRCQSFLVLLVYGSSNAKWSITAPQLTHGPRSAPQLHKLNKQSLTCSPNASKKWAGRVAPQFPQPCDASASKQTWTALSIGSHLNKQRLHLPTSLQKESCTCHCSLELTPEQQH